MIQSTLIFGILLATSTAFIFNKVLEPPPPPPRESVRNFHRNKAALLSNEFTMALGYDIILNPLEKRANKVITTLKLKEIEKGFFDPSEFVLSCNYSDAFDKIEQSPLYQLIRRMPKGGILHTHDSALGSAKVVANLSHNRFCYVCIHNDGSLQFKVSQSQPERNRHCESWKPMEDYRRDSGISDDQLAKHFKLPDKTFNNVNEVWSAFEPIFGTVGGLIENKGNYEEYLRNTLKELLDDGVQYVELRTSVRPLYDINGNQLSRTETIRVMERIVNDFVRENPSFIGAKIIYSKSRNTDNQTVTKYMEEAMSFKSQFPDFMCGFDLVGQEDLGKPLQDFIPELLNAPNHLDFFFHAGETNWYGTTTDENLFDAVMMRTKRIGHGFALNKHPLIVNLIKNLDIGVEVNPISNQVLNLVKDLRNHPAAYLIANNVPMVVSSDDPAYWGAAPLSHDFYVTFLGIASAHADLRLLKKLASNSIKYSCMSPEQKRTAYQKWERNWNAWINDVVVSMK